jgi:hypothetical protein
MSARYRQSVHRWYCACAATAVVLLAVANGMAQQTTYGEDPVPGGEDYGHIWTGYGSDPVPGSTIDDHATLWSYGFDPVPSPRRPSLHRVLPGVEQVLTGDADPGSIPGTSR